jgi:hypothetical protein
MPPVRLSWPVDPVFLAECWVLLIPKVHSAVNNILATRTIRLLKMPSIKSALIILVVKEHAETCLSASVAVSA